MLRSIEADGRLATPDEQTVLARWSGWGAVPGVFDEDDARWADVRTELRELIGDESWAQARRSTLNAHYTDPNVVMAMWGAVQDLGFESGRVLEPGCGSGNFIAYAPDGVEMVGVEREATSAAIARALYPEVEIHNTPFEGFDVHTPFDVSIGNVPFAKVAPVDSRFNRGRHTLHNYFLLKSLQLVRPGGLMLALTSRYTLDARNPAARRELAQHGDLLGALRLPSGAMRSIAGTDAILDLLVIRRRPPGADPDGVLGWDRTVEIDVPDETSGATGQLRMNRYLAEHPEHVLGQPVLGRAMYRAGDLLVRGDLSDLGAVVREGLADIVERSTAGYQPLPPPTQMGRAPARRIGDVELRGRRRIALRQGSYVVFRTGAVYQHIHGELVDAELGKGTSDEVRALVELRDTTVNLLQLEADDAPDAEIEAERRAVSQAYDRYRRRWGPLNRVSWQRTGKADPATGEEQRRRVPARLGGFRQDPEWPTLSAIEVYDEETGEAKPATIQQRRTIHPPAPRLGANTADEALAICLDEHGRVDLDRIAELLGVERDVAAEEIAPLVYVDPATEDLVPSETYLSGDVRAKLATARAAVESGPRFHRNVEALEAVQPPQVAPRDIVARPGAPWIDAHDVAAFAAEVLEVTSPKVTYTPVLGSWNVDGFERIGHGQFATMRMGAVHLLEASLNQRMVRVYDYDDKKRVLNVAETTAAREKQEIIADRFSRWVWEDDERSARLADRYNALFNSYVPPSYSGDHLTLPGLATSFVPHGHQRTAVARILREGRALLGHAVGAGKTATMVMAGMELRRLGLVDRPAYVVPNHMLEQFSREFLQLYPQARLLVTTRNLTGAAGRKEFVARAATGDWDGVILTHSAFERLPLEVSTFEAYISHHTDELRASVSAARAAALEAGRVPDRDQGVKRMELALERRENQLKRLLDLASKDDGISFERSGIDYLFVDELHLFKNRTIVTAVEGISRQGSKRATDLDAKLWYLQKANGARSLVGATATPIANSVSEAWVMQTYVQPDVLAEAGLGTFDAWAATFAQQVNAVELAPDGGSYRVATRLARYMNVPELIGQFRRTADIRLREDLDLRLPALTGDGPEVVVVPASPALEDYVDTLVRRAEQIRNRAVDPEIDNMLKVTSDGRHAALDMRLVGGPPDPEGGKLAAAAERIAHIYQDTRDLSFIDASGEPAGRRGGFQFVFCDLSTPKADGSWNAYDELKRRLVALGVPSDEIAFIHDAKNDEARAQLFARCREGQIAVLVGSTEKMGVGTNIHTRAVALHHIDCPWRPADIEQREGRIIRQGNQNERVQIIRYATEGSFDVYMWQTVERKGAFISQLMRGDNIGRDIDDVGDAVLSYSEVKALASGNPLIIEQAGVQAEMAKYERLEHAHREEQRLLKDRATSLRRGVDREQKRADALQAAISRRIDTSGDRFKMEITGDEFVTRSVAAEALKTVLTDSFEQLGISGDESDDLTLEAADTSEEVEKLDDRQIGSLAGFDLRLSAERWMSYAQAVISTRLGDGHDLHLRMAPHDLSSESFNLIARLENSIRSLDRDLELTLDQITRATTDAEAIEARIGQPFPHRERLAKLRTRNQQILDHLNAQAEEAAKADLDRHRPPSENPETRLDGLKNPPDGPPPAEGPSL